MAQKSLGKVTITTAGTPERSTKNNADPAAVVWVHSYLVQQVAANTGKVWIGSSGMNKTTGVGVYAVLPVPTANTLPSFSATVTQQVAAFDMAAVYIDVDVNGEAAIVSLIEA